MDSVLKRPRITYAEKCSKVKIVRMDGKDKCLFPRKWLHFPAPRQWCCFRLTDATCLLIYGYRGTSLGQYPVREKTLTHSEGRDSSKWCLIWQRSPILSFNWDSGPWGWLQVRSSQVNCFSSLLTAVKGFNIVVIQQRPSYLQSISLCKLFKCIWTVSNVTAAQEVEQIVH